jgi:hypothetical protein
MVALVAGCGLDLLGKFGDDPVPTLTVKVRQIVLDLTAP